MFGWVDVSEYAEGISITATESKVMIDTNNFVHRIAQFWSIKVTINTSCQKVLILKTPE